MRAAQLALGCMAPNSPEFCAALEQVNTLKDSQSKTPKKQQFNGLFGNVPDDGWGDYDPWSGGAQGSAEGEGQSDGWGDELNAVIAALKGRGKGPKGKSKGKGKGECWECVGPHKRSECAQFTDKLKGKEVLLICAMPSQ